MVVLYVTLLIKIWHMHKIAFDNSKPLKEEIDNGGRSNRQDTKI